MARVQGPSIEANIGAETARLNVPLRTIVAVLAQSLKRAKPEFVDVAAMWLDVIADCRRLDDAALRAILTQRMLEQLVPPDPRPAPGAIPGVPLRRLTANAHGFLLAPSPGTASSLAKGAAFLLSVGPKKGLDASS
jgi:hypothetical protein